VGVTVVSMTTIAPEYVLARAVLLDALDALGPHRDAVVLVDAQAVYLHAGEAELATAPMTTMLISHSMSIAWQPRRSLRRPCAVAASSRAINLAVGEGDPALSST
jgi:hypothetical protein